MAFNLANLPPQLLQQLQELDIDSMTPRDAMDCLYELKKLSEKIES